MQKSAHSLNWKITMTLFVASIIFSIGILGSFLFIQWPQPWTIVLAVIAMVSGTGFIHYVTNRRK
ncbi:hypothetical protein [Lacticaseibacillus brantae]|uniref:Uncharacterized protein n=1 Tax=Lacticaseibacillus brantae DSM 23927 TaxID=1423727 RepID=A0A0R2AWW0_9LACO|nr:hypothetical protein [Lacticaseibacillus brantae]KRM71896.1 hypothetical protein FC34_GL000872 [Lacticaseibacillus brantae DSM 23927]